MPKIDKKIIQGISKHIQRSLCIIDTETTNVDTNTAEIISFAGLRINPDGTYSVLEFICQPEGEIHPSASEVNGFYKTDLEHLPNFKKFIPELIQFLKDADINGYNVISFDVKIIKNQLKKHGIEDPFKEVKFADAFTIYKKHNPRKLGDAHFYYLKKEIENAHDALGDVISVAKIINKQIEKDGALLFEEKKENGSKFISKNKDGEFILNFTKHKGKPLKDLDKGFFNWMLKQSFVDDQTKKQVKEFLLKEKKWTL
jgi:DNA polymerase-3 subunit epsilon